MMLCVQEHHFGDCLQTTGSSEEVGPDAHERQKELVQDWDALLEGRPEEEEKVLVRRIWDNLVKKSRCDCLWIVFVVVFLFLFPN
jgi:hypothetical protein